MICSANLVQVRDRSLCMTITFYPHYHVKLSLDCDIELWLRVSTGYAKQASVAVVCGPQVTELSTAEEATLANVSIPSC